MNLNKTEWLILGTSTAVCAGALLSLAMMPSVRSNTRRGGPRSNRLRRWGEK